MMWLANQVLGTWRLESFTARYTDRPGTIHPLGEDATGLIMYTADGYMSAQIMRQGREDYDLLDSDGSDLVQAAAAATGYLAYSGRYTADEATRTLHHNVEVSLLPAWLDTIQIREATLDGDRLTLVADDPFPGGTVHSVLTWKRPRPKAG
ncbi:lipocalin-like domain-containing protein [Streptomyces liangshanensis]|uniref:Lipocalin-like domain-containing protein n=1 Tax=Streptomyces liangshanensis TaxID=2717324 RepID=A0A6G9H6L4_9ACTN|nr:lipocalin-like domain-containing protein [Streptomyces liangshanensis]QIQ06084.1 lipocalin-like domain-containing protein [Streptomyces liangshanensis]